MARFLTAISSFPVIRDLSFPPAGQWRKPDSLRHVLGRQAQAARLLTGQPTASIQDGLAWIRQTPHAARRTPPGHVRPQHAKVLGGLIHEYERAA
jgi:hypothetical protein